MSMRKMVAYTPGKLKRLKAALKKAKESGKGRRGTFEFDGNEYVVGYAEYLIEYLEPTLVP